MINELHRINSLDSCKLYIIKIDYNIRLHVGKHRVVDTS